MDMQLELEVRQEQEQHTEQQQQVVAVVQGVWGMRNTTHKADPVLGSPLGKNKVRP
jgi:hypothetical protein